MTLNKFARRGVSGVGGRGEGGTPTPADPSPSGFVSRGAPPSPPPPTLTKPTPQPAEQYTALRTAELASMGIPLTPALGATLLGLSWQHEAAHQAREAAAGLAEAVAALSTPADAEEAKELMAATREHRQAVAHASKLTTEARKAELEWWALVRAGR